MQRPNQESSELGTCLETGTFISQIDFANVISRNSSASRRIAGTFNRKADFQVSWYSASEVVAILISPASPFKNMKLLEEMETAFVVERSFHFHLQLHHEILKQRARCTSQRFRDNRETGRVCTPTKTERSSSLVPSATWRERREGRATRGLPAADIPHRRFVRW